MNALSSRKWSAVNAIVIVTATLLMWPFAASAQLKVLISGGFSGPYEQLLPEFERTTGIKVTTGSGSSQGTGPQTIGAQLARGVPTDVVILSREGLKELIAANRIRAGRSDPYNAVAVSSTAASPSTMRASALVRTLSARSAARRPRPASVRRTRPQR